MSLVGRSERGWWLTRTIYFYNWLSFVAYTYVLGNNVYRVGGGAGGASGGDGGDSSDITFLATTTADPAGFGSAGYVIEFPIFTRPESLLH